MKKTAALVAAVAVMFIASYSVAAQMKVSLDGRELAFDKEPKMINNRVMVPVRKILEELGASVTYDIETSTATAVKDAHYAQFRNGSDYLLLGVCADGKNDGELSYSTSAKLDSNPVILNDTMYVPLRAVSEAFYYDVDWDAKTQTAKITTPGEADGWIYYSCWNDKGHMYKIDTNGQNRQMITDGDCYMEDGHFCYNDGYIYYALRDSENSKNDGKVYRIKTDGTGKEKISDKPIRFISDYSPEKNNDALYFFEKPDNKDNEYYWGYKGYLKRFDLKTTEITSVYDEEIQFAQRYKDYIYFRYAKEEKDRYVCYRMDTNGENIIKVTGDIPADYLSFDEENDRLRFSDALTYTNYTAALDGSDLQKKEKDANEDYDAIKEKYNFEAFTTIDNDGSNSEQTDLVIIGTKDDGYTYFIKDDGKEVFELKLPEGVHPYNVVVADDRLFYDVQKGKSEPEKWYVDSIDEIMGIGYISVGTEKVDGKYEISERRLKYVPSEEDGIYCIKFDDGVSRKILDQYRFVSGRIIEDNKLLIANTDNIYYTAELDGSNIKEYGTRIYNNDAGLNLKENAMYGIIVKNDGTVERYSNSIRPY